MKMAFLSKPTSHQKSHHSQGLKACVETVAAELPGFTHTSSTVERPRFRIFRPKNTPEKNSFVLKDDETHIFVRKMLVEKILLDGCSHLSTDGLWEMLLPLQDAVKIYLELYVTGSQLGCTEQQRAQHRSQQKFPKHETKHVDFQLKIQH